MPYLTTGSTELKAVNQILASVGSGTTLTTEEANIPVGTYIGGTGVATGTSIAVAGVQQNTSPVTYTYTINISQTIASQALTQNKVTTRVETQTNPDVAIALNTLREVSREVQAEGWTYNTEFDYKITPDSNNEINIPDDVLQMDLNQGYPENIEKDAVFRGGKLYDKKAHSYKWTAETVYVDILWYFEWENIPAPIQAYIVARAAAIVSSRIVGDTNQYQILQQKELTTRSQALEYECNQGDFTFFGSPSHGNFYRPYKPFHTLQR
jgi:hypothetical protein